MIIQWCKFIANVLVEPSRDIVNLFDWRYHENMVESKDKIDARVAQALFIYQCLFARRLVSFPSAH